MIDSIKLNEKDLDSYCQIMSKGNTHLRILSEMVGMEKVAFRARLFKDAFNPLDWPELTIEQLVYFGNALPEIQAVRNIEWTMIRAFAGLVHKHAKASARKKAGSTVVDMEDFSQEALLALLDAIYTYTQVETQFITYAWWVIHNRLSNAANKDSPFTPLTNEAIALLQRFDEAKGNLPYYANEDAVFDACNFSANERRIVQAAKTKVFNTTALQETLENDNFNCANDYTAIRRGIDNEKDTVSCHYEIRDALEKANLDVQERKVVETSMCPYYGWQTALAKTLMNPKGKPYTRAGIGFILARALRKIKTVYLRKHAA